MPLPTLSHCASRRAASARGVASSSGSVAGAAAAVPRRPAAWVGPLRRSVAAAAHKVELTHEGKTTVLEVPDGENILTAALDQGLDLPHDCRLGVCMTCPARLVSGNVDQSGSMLSDDVAEKGFALMCVAVPTSDCKVETVTEDELLDEQFADRQVA